MRRQRHAQLCNSTDPGTYHAIGSGRGQCKWTNAEDCDIKVVDEGLVLQRQGVKAGDIRCQHQSATKLHACVLLQDGVLMRGSAVLQASSAAGQPSFGEFVSGTRLPKAGVKSHLHRSSGPGR